MQAGGEPRGLDRLAGQKVGLWALLGMVYPHLAAILATGGAHVMATGGSVILSNWLTIGRVSRSLGEAARPGLAPRTWRPELGALVEEGMIPGLKAERTAARVARLGVALGLLALIAGCTTPGLFNAQPGGAVQPSTAIGTGQVKVALILPLSAGGNAGIAALSMKNAAEMALAEFNSPNIQLLVKDDAGTPGGASASGATGSGRRRRDSSWGRCSHSRSRRSGRWRAGAAYR